MASKHKHIPCIFIYIFVDLLQFCCGATAQLGPSPLLWWFVYHPHADIQPVRRDWTSDRHVAKAATYSTQNKHNRRISTLLTGFEPAISEIERLEAYALDRTATEMTLALFASVITPAFIEASHVVYCSTILFF